MSGYYKMYRGWMSNPVFGSESFTRAQAWEWLIGEAGWKDRTVTIGFKGIQLERGQLCKSVRVIAAEWKWEHTKVLRFIRRLEAEKMVTTDGATGLTIISICNYDQYQSNDDEGATDDETAMQQQRNTIATTIKKDNKSKTKSISRDDAKTDFEAWYAAYPRRVDPGRARKAYATALNKTAPDVLLSAARAYAVECSGKDEQFIKHPATWLNAESWLNQRFPPVNGHPPTAGSPDTDRWKARVSIFRTSETWDPDHGPLPGEPGCRVPPPILAEFGYGERL